jgi:hypothetical protein
MDLDYLIIRRDRVLELTLEHLQLCLLAMAIALVIAIPIGAIASRYSRLTLPVLGILGVLYTIPSLAFLAFLIPTLGIGVVPAVTVLAAYAQIFLVRNITAGLRGVDAGTLEAAQGLGLSNWQVFRQVRLPLALPVIIEPRWSPPSAWPRWRPGSTLAASASSCSRGSPATTPTAPWPGRSRSSCWRSSPMPCSASPNARPRSLAPAAPDGRPQRHRSLGSGSDHRSDAAGS